MEIMMKKTRYLGEEEMTTRRRAYNFRMEGTEVLCDVEDRGHDSGNWEGLTVLFAVERDDLLAECREKFHDGCTAVAYGDGTLLEFWGSTSRERILGFMRRNGLNDRADAIRRGFDKLDAEFWEKQDARDIEALENMKLKDIQRVFYLYAEKKGDDLAVDSAGVTFAYTDEEGRRRTVLKRYIRWRDTIGMFRPLSRNNPVVLEMANATPEPEYVRDKEGKRGVYIIPCTRAQELAANEAEKAMAAERVEIAYYGGSPIVCDANDFLHSLAASEEGESIQIYSTRNMEILDAPSIGAYAEELSAMGAEQDGKYQWSIPLTDENREKVWDFLKAHDVSRPRHWDE